MTSERLREVGKVDANDIHDRFREFQRQQQVVAQHARIGALVSVFDNDEIHHLCEVGMLTIGDVLDLRRLGLLAPDEGWTGGPRPRTKRKDAAKAAGRSNVDGHNGGHNA